MTLSQKSCATARFTRTHALNVTTGFRGKQKPGEGKNNHRKEPLQIFCSGSFLGCFFLMDSQTNPVNAKHGRDHNQSFGDGHKNGKKG